LRIDYVRLDDSLEVKNDGWHLILTAMLRHQTENFIYMGH